MLCEFVMAQLRTVEAFVGGEIGLVGHDRDLRIAYWGRRMETMLGLRAEEVLGRFAPELPSFPADGGIAELLREALEGKRAFPGECAVAVPSTIGRGIYESLYSPLHDRDGAIVGVAAVIRDVTERCELTEQLEKTIRDHQRVEAQLRQSVRDREEFLSIASHELRTPLTALQLTLEKLLRSTRKAQLDGDNHPFVRDAARAVAQVHRLDELVEELLDVSRLSNGRLELQLEAVDLGAIVAASIERLTDALHGARCSVSFDKVSVVGRWDGSRLERVTTNLLSNALKYGPGKPIRVRVVADGDWAILTVRDEGIGIAAADQPRVFEQFERAVSSRNYSGFGLGLWIVREIVRKHGGWIGVASTPGGGTTFTVSLPREPSTQARERGSSESSEVEACRSIRG
jgi:PAS domain S-box-containing protein